MTKEQIDQCYPGLLKLHKKGVLYASKDISWVRAQALKRDGYATITMFHNRWQGKVEITEEGKAFVKEVNG